MRLETAQYEYIKQTVIDTYLEYGIKCIPINAFELAIKMGIKLTPYSALSKEGKEAARLFSMDGFSSIETAFPSLSNSTMPNRSGSST